MAVHYWGQNSIHCHQFQMSSLLPFCGLSANFVTEEAVDLKKTHFQARHLEDALYLTAFVRTRACATNKNKVPHCANSTRSKSASVAGKRIGSCQRKASVHELLLDLQGCSYGHPVSSFPHQPPNVPGVLWRLLKVSFSHTELCS